MANPLLEDVRILSYLYSVLIGISLTTAFTQIVQTNSSPFDLWRANLNGLLTLGSFVCIVIPFYHGAALHLSRVLSGEKNYELRVHLRMITYTLMLTEGLIFLGMALAIKSLSALVDWLVFLLYVDSLWVMLMNIIKRRNSSNTLGDNQLDMGTNFDFVPSFRNCASTEIHRPDGYHGSSNSGRLLFHKAILF